MMNERTVLKRAFPSNLVNEVNGILEVVDLVPTLERSDPFCVKVGDEILEIPYRIGYKESNLEVIGALSPVQAELLNCLFTRHYDGFIRERCASRIIASDNIWIPPYIVRLLGEYVIEILYVIERNLSKLELDVYREFLVSNREFYGITKQRVASYWNCYYRWQYPKRDDYVGFKIARFFDQICSVS